MSGYLVRARNSPKGYSCGKELQGSRHSMLGTIERISGYLVITRSTGNDCKNGKCTWLSIRVYRWNGIAKAMAQSIEGTSESDFGIF